MYEHTSSGHDVYRASFRQATSKRQEGHPHHGFGNEERVSWNHSNMHKYKNLAYLLASTYTSINN